MKKLFIAAALAAASFSASATTAKDCEYFGEFSAAAALDRDNGFTAEDTIRHIVRYRDKMSDAMFAASMLIVRTVHDDPVTQNTKPFVIGRNYYEACMNILEKEGRK